MAANLCENDIRATHALYAFDVSVTSQTEGVTAGWLMKKGHMNTAWKNRYFILRDNRFEYYTDEPVKPSAKFRGFIPVQNSTLMYVIPEDECENADEVLRGFVLQIKREEGGPKEYYMKAYTKASCEHWLSCFRKLCMTPICVGWLRKKSRYTQGTTRLWYVLGYESLLHCFSAPGGTWRKTVDLTGAHIEWNDEYPLDISIQLWKQEDTFVVRAMDSNSFSKWKKKFQQAAALEFTGFGQVHIAITRIKRVT